MPANSNMVVCAAASPRLLIKIDAHRTGPKATRRRNRTGPTSYFLYPRWNQVLNAADQRAIGRLPSGEPSTGNLVPPPGGGCGPVRAGLPWSDALPAGLLQRLA
jgi:hypothetical protein